VIIRGRQVDNGLIVSATAHAALLLWAGVSFAARPYTVPPTETVEVDVLSEKELSQVTAGAKTAPKKEVPKKFAEKKDPPKAVEHPELKVADKEIMTASAAPEQPKEVKPPEPKPVEHAAKPKPKPPEKKIPDAESLHKTEKKKEEVKKVEPKHEPKKEPPKHEVVKHDPPKKPEPKPKVAHHKSDAPKLDFDRIAALLDKRQPQRVASAGDVINREAALGTQHGAAQHITQSELDALRAKIESCWEIPPGGLETQDLRVEILVHFRKDGSLADEPRLLTRPTSAYHGVVGESALRAIRRCAPYTEILSPAKYDDWKEIQMGFDPNERNRG
jgi:colicin import membrane protein